jgi:hypothetical protein
MRSAISPSAFSNASAFAFRCFERDQHALGNIACGVVERLEHRAAHRRFPHEVRLHCKTAAGQVAELDDGVVAGMICDRTRGVNHAHLPDVFVFIRSKQRG